MSANPARFGAPNPHDPVLHDLPALRISGAEIPVRLAAWRSEDGLWRGRLLFGPHDALEPPATADIFCAATENDLWQSVRDLREHHVRDLYRSLAGD
jgi:hypothetical protein